MKHPHGHAGHGGHGKKHAKHNKHVHGKGKKHHPKHQHQGHHQQQGTGGGFVHTVMGHAKHPRGLAIGDALPVCTFEALAASLRLLGQRVSDDDVAELWWLAGAREVSIAEALEAAVRFGLAGVRPFQQRHVSPVDAEALRGKVGVACGELGIDPREGLVEAAPQLSGESFGHGLILGVDLPGPHAVLATPDGWWSWGELWSPWTTAISEAWAVSWL